MNNFIEVYNNVFSSEFCEEAIAYINRAEELNFTVNRQEHDNASKLDKEDLAVFVPDSFLEHPLRHTSNKLVTEFNNVFWTKCYKQYSEKYDILTRLREHKSYIIKIQKTKPGQGYHVWHCESTGRESSNRLLAWTAYLNDDFEAGETEFLYQQYRYKPSKGDCVIFPAAFTHTHRGNPPIGGDKYIITGWVEF